MRRRDRRDQARAELALIELCPPCHRAVHATLSEKQLEQSHRTIESLRAHPDLARFVKWVRKQPVDRSIRSRTANALRESRRTDRDRRRRR